MKFRVLFVEQQHKIHKILVHRKYDVNIRRTRLLKG